MRVRSLLILLFVLTVPVSVFSQELKPDEKWATFEGNKVRYYDIGNSKAKNALVLIHGWTCNADFWKDSLNAFPGYRVIAMDLPGHGRSDRPEISYTMEHFARSVKAVLDNANVNGAVLVGHSMGTPVATQFYRLYPRSTIAIVDVDMPLLALGSKEEMKGFVSSVIGNYPQSASTFIDGMISSIRDANLRSFIKTSMLSTPKHVAVSALTETFDEKVWVTELISVPVLAMTAKSATRQPIREDFAKVAPKVEFQLWADAGHFLMMEQPARFNGQVKGFILRNKLL